MFSETEEGGGDSAFLLPSPSSMQKLPNIKEERKKVKKKKTLERILKEQVFSARRCRRSTSETQRKRAKREAQRVCACPLGGFDCSCNLTSEMLSRFKENIKEMSYLVVIQGVVFLTLSIVRENWRRNLENIKRNCI